MSQSLTQKLRLKPEDQLTILNRPNYEYFSEFDVIEEYPKTKVNTIILFVKNIEELKKETFRLINDDVLNVGGRLLIAYPKKGNKTLDSYIHRDDIFPALEVDDNDGYIKDSNYKFNQMVKLDETYTIVGIKRVKKRTADKATSQSVDDYIKYIPDIEKALEKEKDALIFFQSLTSGYQKNWARYIYSAKRTTTQDKRKQEMIDLLKRGIKSKELA